MKTIHTFNFANHAITIYSATFLKYYDWEEFIENIEDIKLAFKYVSALDNYYKNNITNFSIASRMKVSR